MSWIKMILFFLLVGIANKILRDSLPVMDVRPGLKKFFKKLLAWSFIAFAYSYAVIKGNKNQQQVVVMLIIAILYLVIVTGKSTQQTLNKTKEIE